VSAFWKRVFSLPKPLFAAPQIRIPVSRLYENPTIAGIASIASALSSVYRAPRTTLMSWHCSDKVIFQGFARLYSFHVAHSSQLDAQEYVPVAQEFGGGHADGDPRTCHPAPTQVAGHDRGLAVPSLPWAAVHVAG
jgi:hypothetical protein